MARNCGGRRGGGGGCLFYTKVWGTYIFPPGLTKPSLTKISLIVSSLNNSTFTQQDGKTLVCDKHDKAITCVFCRDLH